MSIRIKRSSGDNAPASLASGQLAYTEGSTNGGTLYYGEIGGNVIAIGGKKYITKLDGIEAGAQVNDVTSVAGRTGAVVVDTDDLASFNEDVDARIAAAEINDLSDVQGTPSNGQVLTWNSTGSYWEPQAAGSGVTEFVSLNDTPAAFTGSGAYFVRVNSGATALEFVQDVDDGTF
jgi:hypothetical protein